ncbi:MAG: hypothetical protein U0636_08705 [Phycisphaerales bacterium]
MEIAVSNAARHVLAVFLALPCIIGNAAVATFLVAYSDWKSSFFDIADPGTEILWWLMALACTGAVCLFAFSCFYRPRKKQSFALAILQGTLVCWLSMVFFDVFIRGPGLFPTGALMCLATTTLFTLLFAWNCLCVLTVFALRLPPSANKRRQSGRCGHCGYPLSSEGVRPCPECGRLNLRAPPG